MNVHRWRVLGGKDPTAMELIDKVNQLQRRLLSKTNVNVLKMTSITWFAYEMGVFQELIKKDLKVEGLEMELKALRDYLSKIPPSEELSEEARNLR